VPQKGRNRDGEGKMRRLKSLLLDEGVRADG
jgi:hypothetical protein